MYTFNSRIRYSEVNCDCQLTLSNITNYFQDCTTFHSEDLGVGVEHSKHLNKAWILNSWQVIVNRFPKLGEEVTIGTWATTNKGIYGNRNFILKDKAGNDCAVANAIWIYMDLEKGVPCRLTEEIMAPYETGEPYPMEYAPRKITLPENFTEKERVTVTPLYIDSNNHVNNSQYIKIAESCLPEDFSIKQMRAEYRSSAHLGDIIIAMIAENDKLFTVSLENPNGEIFAIVEFTAM